MALVLGVNAGFVTEAPIADPEGSNITIDYYAIAIKDVAPVGAVKIVEIGWWCDSATQAANFDVGIYDHNVGDDEPEAKVGDFAVDNAKGITAGWKRVTGLNIPITAEETYWIAVQLDSTATSTNTNYQTTGGTRRVYKSSQTALIDPWGTSGGSLTWLHPFYAVYEEAPSVTNPKVKVSGTFETKKIMVKISNTFLEKPIIPIA